MDSFILEHLATFTVSKDNNSGILYPEDGMRRLLELEKSTGIWSQKMEMTISRNQNIMIHDFDTKSLIEKFPIDWIELPTPFTNPNPLELYNNILVFIVAPPAGIASHNYPEMHIFQCQNIDAKVLCDFLKNDAEEYEEKPVYYSKEQHSPQKDTSQSSSRYKGILAESDIPMSTQHERDVKLLNYCFDDIEKFIARLQHSAAATRELERRRKKQKEGGYLPPGQGLLSIRTRPPTEPEFVDIFAKFKLSFNLLAKLRAHIHDPNAPELVHFLFTPLALIVDAAHDLSISMDRSRNAVINVPSQVIAPLLTTDAINLLLNCVSSKETELWRSLGDAWQLSKDEFLSKYEIDLNCLNYTPKFFDGWTPEFPIVLEDNYNQMMPPAPESASQFHSNEPLDNISDDSIDNVLPQHQQQQLQSLPPQHVTETDTISSNKYEERLSQWLRELHARKAKVFRVTYPRTANNEKELSVVRGEILEILDDTRKWWKARNILGQTAHVPHTIVTRYTPSDSKDVFENPLYSQKRSQEAASYK